MYITIPSGLMKLLSYLGFVFFILFFVFLPPQKIYAAESLSFSSSSSVTTASGNVGDTTNTIFLTSGARHTTYTFYWDSTGTGTTVNLGTCATSGSSTACSLAITIPHSSQGNWVIHSNSSGGNGANTLTFTVNPKVTNSTPASGNYSTSVTVTGTGFAAESVTAYFGSTTSYPLGSATPTSGTGGTNGDLSVTGTVPQMPFGNYTMRANGTTSGNITSSFSFSMSPSITLSSSSGRWGSTTTVGGYGFAASTTITIIQDGTATSTTGSSDSTGSFSGVVYTPTGIAGSHTLAAKDTAPNTSGNQTYTMSPAITISSSSGNSGATTNVSGNGFAASSTITIIQDGSNTATTGSSNTTGSFTNIVYTPTGAAGSHTINATDASTNTALAQNYTINGTLSMTTPGSVNLSAVTLSYPNPNGTGSLGTVQVVDNRFTNVGWNLTATTTSFYQVGAAVKTSGSNNTVTSGGTYNNSTGGTYTITITTGGAVGTAKFSVAGLESATNQTTGTGVAVGTRGVTATFGAATYVLNDSWTVRVDTIPVTNLTLTPNTFTTIAGSSTGVSNGSAHTFANTSDATTVLSASAGNGMGSYSDNPALQLSVPAATYANSYSATITETVN